MTEIFFRRASERDADIVDAHTEASTQEASAYRGSIPEIHVVGEEVSFIAGMGESILGSLVIVRSPDGKAHICRVYVEPSAREIGIGDRLVSGVLEELAQTGCHWVSGVALPGDRQTKNLFERHGLVAQSITVGRSLSGSSTEEDASR